MGELLTCSQCVEKICQQGCLAVRDVIDRLEHQQSVDELEHLDNSEKTHVLNELKSIMSVYDRP